MKTFKHKRTGEIATYKDGVFKQGNCCVEIGTEPSSEFWEEVIEYPVGTKVIDTLSIGFYGSYTYEKFSNGKWKIGTQDYFTIPDSQIGEGKRFKVVEETKKEYEVLSLNIHDYRISNAVGCSDVFIEALLKNKPTKIHSVKRLSDGEIFTIGDKIKQWGTGSYSVIEKIYFNEHRQLSYKLKGIKIDFTDIFSELTEKFKSPLFTTEDGVDIYDSNHKLFEVILSNFHLNLDIPLTTCNDSFDKRKDGFPSKVFSTKEAAEEYILWNKPCISLKDVASIYPGINKEHNTPSHQAERLKELVKSRL